MKKECVLGKKHPAPGRLLLPVLFSVIVFIIFLITAAIVMLVSAILLQTGTISLVKISRQEPIVPFAMLLMVSIIIGTVVSFVISRIPLRPIRRVIDAINRLAAGDFSVRLSTTTAPTFRELVESFNRMAEELGGTELLRTDFINNFSHEFKTPIVSIKGFAEELKHDDLSKEQRDEYLDIIIAESSRLASLATNVLNLSKIEQQVILTDQKEFNLTEQVRRCILLFENKWEKKHLSLNVEMEELSFTGSEELLNQIWLNLIDNAVKFTPQGGVIGIRLNKSGGEIRFVITDDGCGIPADAVSRVFDKFYQADPARASSGNGIGLTVAKRIAELHGGTIVCRSEEGVGTEFTVTLPL
ncbi:MAG TPA: HAMP domain-containing sensor histidine kinase [Candidatus Cryosericum sp.]|nr:HAMP domain-containing sensor histidine kinase [Candidatus Cryosericum sp.]